MSAVDASVTNPEEGTKLRAPPGETTPPEVPSGDAPTDPTHAASGR